MKTRIRTAYLQVRYRYAMPTHPLNSTRLMFLTVIWTLCQNFVCKLYSVPSSFIGFSHFAIRFLHKDKDVLYWKCLTRCKHGSKILPRKRCSNCFLINTVKNFLSKIPRKDTRALVKVGFVILVGFECLSPKYSRC